MSDKELLAQIAQVAGAINKHMHSPAAHGYSTHNVARGGGYAGRGRSRGRGGVTVPIGSFNRKLTLNNATATPSPPASPVIIPRPLSSPMSKSMSMVNPIKSFMRPPMPSRHLALINNSKTTGTTELSGTSSLSPSGLATSPFIARSTSLASTPSTSSTSTSALASPAASPSTPALTPTASPKIQQQQLPQQQQQQQWIQSKGKNMSLMSPASYKKTMEAKQKSIKSSKEKKLKLRQAQAKLANERRSGIVTVGGKQYKKSLDGRKLVMRDTSQDSIVINGVAFEMDPRGNKLVRKSGTSTSDSSVPSPSTAVTLPKKATSANTVASGIHGATPKQFSIGGVIYVRTRNGNLVRAKLVENKLRKKRVTQEQLKQKSKKVSVPKKPRAFCKFFTRFGRCSKGFTCPFVHSKTHLAICKKFLRGTCPNTANTCYLSHTPSPHNTPACAHFQRAACNKDNCLYPHIRINPQAPICRPFAKEGWCDAGANCKDRHVWICPDFGTPAGCTKKCGLAHVANGGLRVKRNAEEMGKETDNNGDDNKRRRMDSDQRYKSVRRYMEGSQENQEVKDTLETKKLVYDENFVPFDADEETEEVQDMSEQDENEVMGDFEGNQEGEEDEEDDEEDISSDEVGESDEEVESEDVEEDEDDFEDDIEDEEEEKRQTSISEMECDKEEEEEDENENEDENEDADFHGELQRFYDEQDSDSRDYY
ncbi:hypothetical protein BX616_010256 [Lobosporangium transversale]|uniref:C3H1-type domain-containing protein n=1 Tax=Lobosporangium transversale TaxID=64571 RepID=A0A1Y2G690_9FUNG|nr:hypothetical protein BCR41DRAFT_343147 [Lobosporangium transversale]KAF9912748.1 hypothetical protein BX616_010256 [Lobosporangium transversale]ORY97097.1 hypothetical protein BCR41DRAFT_343147 [Lobosporangium transversale]|eukprot:XP_021875630.1 hypothetical protein BCR41DRAFT_343147 [Lobosporangium transversale]